MLFASIYRGVLCCVPKDRKAQGIVLSGLKLIVLNVKMANTSLMMMYLQETTQSVLKTTHVLVLDSM
jgi:hypothetical protein